MRKDSVRTAQTRRDAVYGLDIILKEYEEAFDMKVSKDGTAEIFKVLLEGTATCNSICKHPKSLLPLDESLIF